MTCIARNIVPFNHRELVRLFTSFFIRKLWCLFCARNPSNRGKFKSYHLNLIAFCIRRISRCYFHFLNFYYTFVCARRNWRVSMFLVILKWLNQLDATQCSWSRLEFEISFIVNQQNTLAARNLLWKRIRESHVPFTIRCEAPSVMYRNVL